jgi:speckle-type POZ protein
LDTGEGADVTFSVGGETLTAHKIVLAMRSPVLKAELFGQMKEAKEHLVTIQDMQPDVFRALLHFIYTDSLPDMDDQDGEGNRDMIHHLLVAADRYAVDRMKLVCASILCKNLDVETVSTTLALAYQHSCDRLKDVCLEFITSSSSVMDSLVATQGYQNLKATCPSALVDAYEKSSKRFRKT